MSVFLRTEAPGATALFEKHKATLERAIQAMHQRTFFAQFPEGMNAYGETADTEAKQRFSEQHGRAFDRLLQAQDGLMKSAEVSPYTQKPLGIEYPVLHSPEAYVKHATAVWPSWRTLTPQARAGVLLEALDRLQKDFFEIAYSTQHTTGQAFGMAFQAAGPHAADRALEAVALGYQEQTRFADELSWEKPVGKTTIVLRKYYNVVPKGVALAIGCSTFPIWNSLPGIYASLVTGNPVIVKPHPLGIYPLAICVARTQEVLQELGLSPNIIQLAVDTPDKPITKQLAENDHVKIIDFTGSNAFGDYIEALPGKATFTEKAGVNCVIIDSASDLGAMAQNVGFSATLYSGQMCTAPQNIYIPKDGIHVAGAHVPYADVVAAIVVAIKGLAEHPKAGPAVLGAIQTPITAKRVADASTLGGKILLESIAIANPEFPEARTASPVLIELQPNHRSASEKEQFGPIAFIVPTVNTEESLHLASANARAHGAISCGAYTTDAAVMTNIAEEMGQAGVLVSFNLTGGVYINQNAAFSDLHVSGANPAGNASMTNPEFVLKRFTLVGVKVNESQPAPAK